MEQRKKQPILNRRVIIEAAAIEFAARGYAAASIGEIVKRSGLTKGALFHHFPDKKSLAEAWVDEIIQPEMQKLWIEPILEVNSFMAMKAFIRSKCLEIRDHSLINSLIALATGDGAIEQALIESASSVIINWRSAIASMLTLGKSLGWIHPSIDPNAESMFMVSAYCGFVVQSGCFRDDNTVNLCASSMVGYLETLRKNE
jgi:TetR/AcrR family transcriptional repressor of nem operon